MARSASILLAALAVLLGACGSPAVVNRLTADTGFKLAADVPYQRSRQLSLDIYYPPNAAGAPVIVFFHGGRWTSLDKSEFKFVGQALTSLGYIAVLPEVRKYPQVRFPDFMDDAALAVKWAHDNAATYGGSADKLFVMGHSSGAHIASLLALNPEYLKTAGGDRSWLRGMIGLAGAYSFMPITAPDLRDLFGPVDRFRYSQPVFYVDGSNPPLMLVHGRDDDVLPVKNTEDLAKAVSKAGGAVETVIYDSLSHNMIVGSLASYLRGRADVLDNIGDFVTRTLKAPRRTPGQVDIKATPLTVEDPYDSGTTPLLAPQPILDAPAVGSELPPTPAPFYDPITGAPIAPAPAPTAAEPTPPPPGAYLYAPSGAQGGTPANAVFQPSASPSP
ncbi:MAG TPA: alpha/beta hydrolase [Fontimonas sp.]